jgi:hypothetical protein
MTAEPCTCTTVLRAEADKLYAQADNAHRDPRMAAHEAVLRKQAHGLGIAVAYLNARETT